MEFPFNPSQVIPQHHLPSPENRPTPHPSPAPLFPPGHRGEDVDPRRGALVEALQLHENASQGTRAQVRFLPWVPSGAVAEPHVEEFTITHRRVEEGVRSVQRGMKELGEHVRTCGVPLG